MRRIGRVHLRQPAHRTQVDTRSGKRRSALAGRINADYYGTIIRAIKGKVAHEQLLATISATEETAAKCVGADPLESRRGHRFRQSDKVATLEAGEPCYAHVSERFCHGEGDLSGPSWRGGVGTMNTWHDELAFAGFLDYC